MGSTQTAYESLLMDNKGADLAKKLRTKENSNPMRRFAAAVNSGRQYEDLFSDVTIIPEAMRDKFKGFLRSSITEVKEDIEKDMTPSNNSQDDLNASMASDPGAGGRRRRTRKNKKSRRKTRKHR
jgi:hypothetical protein